MEKGITQEGKISLELLRNLVDTISLANRSEVEDILYVLLNEVNFACTRAEIRNFFLGKDHISFGNIVALVKQVVAECKYYSYLLLAIY